MMLMAMMTSVAAVSDSSVLWSSSSRFASNMSADRFTRIALKSSSASTVL